MESDNSNIPEKSNKEILLDFFKESIGLENGLGKTIIDLKNCPREVALGYIQGNSQYVSPFKLLFGGLSVWLFVNSFIIDWYAIWGGLTQDYVNFLTHYVFEIDEKKKVKFDQSMLPLIKIVGQVGGDLFSKLYIPMVVFVTPLSAYFAFKWNGKFNVSYRMLLTVNSYVMSANILIILVASIIIAINFYVFIVLIFILLPLSLMGYNFMMIIAPRRFFSSDGLMIEKKIIRANFLAVFIFFLIISTGYFIWFRFLV